MNNGFIANTATLNLDLNGHPDSFIARWTAVYAPTPGAPTVTKDVGQKTFSGAGQPLVYTYEIVNPAGGQPLTDVTLTDSNPAIGEVTNCDHDLTQGIPVGTTVKCTATYTTGVGDVGKGLTNNATLHAAELPPEGITSAGSVDVTYEAPSAPGAPTVVKKGPKYFKRAGETLTYTYTITNPTDGVDLTGIALQDNKAGKVTCDETTLVPGATEKCTASYTTTKRDVRARVIANVAVFTANGGEVKEVSSPWAALLRKRPCHCHRPPRPPVRPVPVTG